MARVPESKIKELRDRDVVDVISKYGVDLKKHGGDELKSCCPFHDETTPSFSVTPSKNLYYCFGCGASGGPIDFVMGIEGVEFPRAVEIMLGGEVANDNHLPRQRVSKPESEPDEWQPHPIMASMDAPAPAPAPATLRVQRQGKWQEFPVVAAWPYYDLAGNLHAYDCRVEPEPGKKDIIPVCWKVNTKTGEAKWKQGSLPKPRLLYGTELLAQSPQAQVIVVEGCGKCDAARRLLAGMPIVVVSWMGGSKAVKFTDWTLLSGRKVVGWPDCDSQKFKGDHPLSGEYLPYIEQAGMSAMLAIAEQLDGVAEGFRIVAVPEPGVWADGWDLADAEKEGWTKDRVLAYLRDNLRTAAELIHVEPSPAPAPATQTDDYAPHEREEYTPPQDYDYPSAPPPAPAPVQHKQPFKFLGWDRLTAHYLPYNSEQIIALTAAAHTKNNMIALAPLSYWEREFPSEKKSSDGVQWDLAVNALIQKSQAHGIYDPDLVRGRGAWWEEGRWAVHLGDRVIIDGDSFPLREAPTRYIYEKSASMQIQFEDPLSASEGVKLVQICERLRWVRPISGRLLAGWVFLAPICGALDWRPHIWITAPAGSGKSTVLKHVVGRCLEGIALKTEGSTSEAGIRQMLTHDARPVVFEEFESDRKKSADRVDDVMDMVVRASSESGAQLYKGSGEGKATGYKTRAMFCFASIAVNIKHFAAATRITVLDMYTEPESEQTLDAFRVLMADIFGTLTPEYIQRLQARAVHMIPVIRQNAQTFAEAAAIALKSRRMGDQIGTLLAGVYALHSSKPISRDDAIAWINRQNWDDVTEAADGKDESSCVAHTLSYQLRVETSSGPLTRTIGELIQRAAQYGESYDLMMTLADAGDTLKRYGIRVDGTGNAATVAFANKHRELRRVLAGTSWETSYERTLGRITGAEKHEPMKYGAMPSRGVRMPISAIM